MYELVLAALTGLSKAAGERLLATRGAAGIGLADLRADVARLNRRQDGHDATTQELSAALDVAMRQFAGLVRSVDGLTLVLGDTVRYRPPKAGADLGQVLYRLDRLAAAVPEGAVSDDIEKLTPDPAARSSSVRGRNGSIFDGIDAEIAALRAGRGA